MPNPLRGRYSASQGVLVSTTDVGKVHHLSIGHLSQIGTPDEPIDAEIVPSYLCDRRRPSSSTVGLWPRATSGGRRVLNVGPVTMPATTRTAWKTSAEI